MLESLCFTYVYCGKNWVSVLCSLQDYNTFLLPQLPRYTLAIQSWLILHNWNFVFLDQHLPFPRFSNLTSLHPLCCHESRYWRARIWCVFGICLSDLNSQLNSVTAQTGVGKASGRKAGWSACNLLGRRLQLRWVCCPPSCSFSLVLRGDFTFRALS